MKQVLRIILLAGTLLGLGIAQAQQIQEATIGPRQTLSFQVKFEGADAAKVKSVQIYMGMTSTPPADQPNFRSGFNSNTFESVGSDTFKPTITIPDDAASGDYVLYINANFNPVGMKQYKGGDQFPMRIFHIKNPTTLVIPKITVTEQH